MKKQKAIESVWLAKTLSVILAVLILVAMYLVPTSATELTTDGASASTVAHSVNAEFTASIPAYVMPGEPGEVSADYTVTLENAVIPDNHELTAKVEYSGSMTEQNGVELPYVLTDATGNTIASGTKILTKSAGAPDESVSVSFGAELTAKARYAGVYTDTATVTFDVVREPYTLEEINANEHLYGIGRTKAEYVVAEFCEDFSEVTIFKNGDDSDGIMMSWSHSNSSPMTQHHNLESVIISNDVTSIGSYAFLDCKLLTSVNIPDSVTSIGNCAFYECYELKDVVIGKNVTWVGDKIFLSCGNIENVTIKSGNFNDYTFQSSRETLKTVTIDSNITGVEDRTFCNYPTLFCVNLPDSITYIGQSAFEHCTSLKNITIPGSVTDIGNSAFEYCTVLENIRIPDNVKHIGARAFSSCKSLTEIIIPEGVTNIEPYSFSGCSALTNVLLPNSVTIIGNWAFASCKALTNLNLPNSLVDIGKGSFQNCSALATAEIPDGVTLIENKVFDGCTALTSVGIPESITQIATDSFSGCKKLQTIYGAFGSYAETFAAENGYTFVAQ